MESAKYVIVGGGVAGTTAAFTIRRHDRESRIVLVSQDSYPLYSRLLLSAIVRGDAKASHVELRHHQDYAKQAVELWSDSSATGLDVDESVLTLADGRRLKYQKLLLATGSTPRQWQVPGAHLSGIYHLRNLDDAECIAARLPKTKHAVVVGGGFIALEHIQSLVKAGIATTVVIRDPYFWAGIWDEESGRLLHHLLDTAPNVRLLYGTTVEVVEGERAVEAVVLSNGHKLPADLILLAIGTDPATDWLTTNGLPTQGGIPTDRYLQTEIDSIWAAGDVALFDDTLLGAVHRLGNWDNASAQGQIAGDNMALATPKAFELLSTYSISFFGTNISFVGDVHHHAKMTAVPRGSARSGAYGRLLLHHDRLVGATLINRFAERGAIDKIIRSQRTLRQQDILDLTDETVPLRQVATRLAA